MSRQPGPRTGPRRGPRPEPRHGPRVTPVRPTLTDPRRAAVDILAEVERGAHADALVGRALTQGAFETRDRTLLPRLVYGVLAWQGRLDWSLDLFATRGIQGLPPPARAALRLGLLQLWVLERVPPHAAVHTSVALTRAVASERTAAFVNAILRRAIREGERPPPEAALDPVGHLAVRWSHPRWLVEQWRADLGLERATRLLAANQEPAATVLRVRPGRAAGSGDSPGDARAAVLGELQRRGARVREARFAPAAIVVDEMGDGGLDALIAGLPVCSQGEASQLVALLAASPDSAPGSLLAPVPVPGASSATRRVLDACAAPGGKTRAIADILARDPVADELGAAIVVGADRSLAGVRSARRLHPAGATSPSAERPGHAAQDPDWVVADAACPPFRPNAFAAVLVDAPCSGLGTLRQHPELRWQRHHPDLERLAAIQIRLLTASAELVRPGGRLVYSTCTISALENEQVVERVLGAGLRLRPIDARACLPQSAHALVDSNGFLRTAPDHDGLDGFFAAAWTRE